MAAISFLTRTSFSISQVGLGNPFDTIGAVGPQHIIVLTNNRIRIFNKQGTEIVSATLGTFFADSVVFDPRVVYDAAATRFYVLAVARKGAGSAAKLMLGISKTSTPATVTSADWNILKEDISQGGEHWLDFPMIGYNADVVTISGVLFPKNPPELQHTHFFAYVIPKPDLLLATPTLANLQPIDLETPTQFSHPIVDMDDGGLPHSLWRWDPFLSIDRLDVTLNGSYSIDKTASIAYEGVIGVSGSQPDGAASLDHTTDDRIGTYPVKIGGYIYIVLSSRISADSTLVVFKIDDATNTVTAQATIHEVGLDLIYPSIAVNSSGHIVIGCTATGTEQFASAMVIVGQDNGTTMTFSDGEIVKKGQRIYEVVDIPTGRNRWGDYSATVVDPINKNRFWTFQTWAFDNSTNNKGRKIEVTEIITNPSGFFDLLGPVSLSSLVLGVGGDFKLFAESTAVPVLVGESTLSPALYATTSETSPQFGED